MHPILITLLILLAIIFLIAWRIRTLPSEKKRALPQMVNRFFENAERVNIFPKNPTFWRDYHRDYPQLKLLEDNYEAVRAECLALLDDQEQLTDISALGGNYTAGGIHTIKWKSFMFKSGEFIAENCALCPQTARVLGKIPGMYTAFFSILAPQQYIKPHWGYYKGFLRYHLGVIIPDNNKEQRCFLRINDDWSDNQTQEISLAEKSKLVEKGEKYYWKNGEGVLFDDTFLHDAANHSDHIRVILWLDIRRKMPFYMQFLNIIFLKIGFSDPSIKKIQDNVRVKTKRAS